MTRGVPLAIYPTQICVLRIKINLKRKKKPDKDQVTSKNTFKSCPIVTALNEIVRKI